MSQRICRLVLHKLRHLRLFHQDAPLHSTHWKNDTDNSGFSRSDRLIIDTLADSADEGVACVYRIFSPFRAPTGSDKRKTITFIVTELGPCFVNFANPDQRPESFTRDGNLIVTPTNWSRDRLVEWGFDADKVTVIPHGVDNINFRPSNRSERALTRKVLGIREDEIVFLNVGAAMWNKGVDLLLLAFAHIRGGRRPIRLILRDRIDMYGFSVATEIKKLAVKNPGLFTDDVMAAISVIQDDLSRDHLRCLYGAADCYVSPYRAEGFNLPVLEAIACGTPAIVTRGGATDDFCNDDVAVRINGKQNRHDDVAAGQRGQYITPDMDELVAAMDGFATGRTTGPDQFDTARESLVRKFSWQNAALGLAQLAVGYPSGLGASNPGHENPRRARKDERQAPSTSLR